MPDRIDWDNLPPLPSKRADAHDRELLAAVRFGRQKAKHNGRNHLSNAKRRQMREERKKNAERTASNVKGKFRKYMAQVRAYWCGDAESHPEKPSAWPLRPPAPS